MSECGDLKNYDHYKQLMKMAGLGLKENSSGTKKGRKHINKRGRAQLRKILKLTALSLIKNNDAFKLSVFPSIGIFIFSSAMFIIFSSTPFASFPITKTFLLYFTL